MAHSLVERRAQTRTLRNVYSWLHPQSRYFDDNSIAMPIEQFEKLCGPIQDTQFDADLAKEIVLNPCLNMAEGLLIEYSIILGYKPTDFILPDGYSFVSRLTHGNPGKELDLTLSVLKSIIKGNEALSEMSEKLNKLIEEKSILDNNESELPRIYPTLQDRIEKCEEVADEEIHDFIDQIEKDSSYQTHLYLFKESRPHFLKGANHVKFIQNAYSSNSVDHCISKPYFDSVFYVMESIVARLSNEELETALAASKGHFTKVLMKKREYISDFKLSSNNPSKNVVMFTARVLLRGPKAACDELAPFLCDSNVVCMMLFAGMPPPLHRFLLESETPVLLQVLFSMRGRYASNNFVEPMDCLVRPGTFPLHKLLKVMLKESQSFKPHMAKVLHCHVIRDCIEKAAAKEEWEETAQALITALSILCGDDRVDKRLYLSLLDDMKKHSKDKSLHEEWLAKYENSEAVAVYIGLMKKKEEPVTNEEEAKVKEEKNEEGETKKMTKKEMQKERERIRKEEEEKKKKEKKEKEREKKKKKREEKEKEKNKGMEEVKTEVEKEGKKEETSDNEKVAKMEQQVEKEEEMKDGTATTHTEDKEATTHEEYEDLDAPAVAESKDETSDGEYEDLDCTSVTEDKEATSDEETEDTDAPAATEDKDEASSSEYENLVVASEDETSSVTGDESSDGEYENIDAEHTENKTNIEKISLLSEASTQENSAESDEELEDIDGVAVDKEKDATEEEIAEDKVEHRSKAAAKEDNADTEQEVKDEGGLKEGNVGNENQVSSAEEDDEFELIDFPDNEEGNVDNENQVSSADDEEEYVLIDSSSDSEVEPIVEFPESDDERLAATQSSTNSQEGVDGFTNSINNMDQIGKTE